VPGDTGSGRVAYVRVDRVGQDLVGGARATSWTCWSDSVSRRFKVVGQHKVPRQRAPNPAREGHYVPWSFRLGSSGLFGAEAPGRWLSRREALAKYRLIFVRYRLYGDTGLLPRRGAAAALRARFGCSAAAPGGSTPTPAGNGNWEILLQVTSAETTRAHTDTGGRSIRRRSSDSPHQGRRRSPVYRAVHQGTRTGARRGPSGDRPVDRGDQSGRLAGTSEQNSRQRRAPRLAGPARSPLRHRGA